MIWIRFLILLGLVGQAAKANSSLEALSATSLIPETETVSARQKAVATSLLDELEQLRNGLLEFEQRVTKWPLENQDLTRQIQTLQSTTLEAVTTNAQASELESRLIQAETSLSTLQSRNEDLQSQQKALTQNRSLLPKSMAEVQEQLVALEQKPNPSPTLKETYRLQVQRFQLQLEHYDTLAENLRLKRELTSLQMERTKKRVEQLRESLHNQRQLQAEQDALEADRAAEAAVNSHPLIRRILQENQSLAEQRAGSGGIARLSETASNRLQMTRRKLNELRHSFQTLKDKASVSRLSETLGYTLRKQLRELPDARQWTRLQYDRRHLITDLQLQMMDLEDDVVGANRVRAMDEFEKTLSPDFPNREKAIQTFRKALQRRRELRESLLIDLQMYFQTLADLEASEVRLAELVKEYRDYIYEHVLWIRSAHGLRIEDFQNLPSSVSWFFDTEHWADCAFVLKEELQANLTDNLIILCVLIATLLLLGPAHNRISNMSRIVARSHLSSFGLTLATWALSCFTSLARGGVLIYLSHRLLSLPNAEDFTRALGDGLQALGLWMILCDTLYSLAQSGGLGEKHFLWRPKGLARIRERLYILLYFGSPCVFIHTISAAQSNAGVRDSAGRLSLFLLCILLAWYAYQILDQEQDPLFSWLQKLPGVGRQKLAAFLIHLFEFLFPVFAILSLLGYVYTVRELLLRVGLTALVILFVLSLEGLFKRWMLLLRRRLIVEREAREAQARALDEEEQETAPAVGEALVLEYMNLEEDSEVDISAINVQAMNLMRGIRTVMILASLWLIWSQFVPALNVFGRIELWSLSEPLMETVVNEDGTRTTRTLQSGSAITVLDLAISLILFFLTWKAHNNLPLLFEALILRRLDLESGQTYAISTLTSYIILLGGIALSLTALGMGWGQVQWLLAAFSVGLGFGLQEIFANFISGLIILFEQPFRVGDSVSIGNVTGVVMKIRMRATTIMDFYRQELIVPNKSFITGQLINVTLSDPTIRIDLNVGVAYGSDTAKVKALCFQAADECEWVLKTPEPIVLFREFGDSSLNFQLRIFCFDYNYYSLAMDKVFCRIDELFRENGIEIPFPQRDLNLRSAGPMSESA